MESSQLNNHCWIKIWTEGVVGPLLFHHLSSPKSSGDMLVSMLFQFVAAWIYEETSSIVSSYSTRANGVLWNPIQIGHGPFTHTHTELFLFVSMASRWRDSVHHLSSFVVDVEKQAGLSLTRGFHRWPRKWCSHMRHSSNNSFLSSINCALFFFKYWMNSFCNCVIRFRMLRRWGFKI